MEAGLPTRTTHTISALSLTGRALLSQAGIPNAEHETVWILEAALGCDRHVLSLERGQEVSSEQWEASMALLSRRANREPLQYILGSQEFCGHEFSVNPSVLIPRPETQMLVGETIRHCGSLSGSLIADIGTGSGCVGISLALGLPEAVVYTTDLSPEALEVTGHNVRRHGVQSRVRILHGDLCAPLRNAGLTGRCAAVVCNPPYIADRDRASLQPEVRDFEPHLALMGGEDGMGFHRRLLSEAPPMLMPGGILVVEVGQGQADSVRRLSTGSRWVSRSWTIGDEGGIERVVCFERSDS